MRNPHVLAVDFQVRVFVQRRQDRVLVPCDLEAQRDLGLPGSVLLCKPVSEGLSPDDFTALKARAQAELAANGVAGRDSTPFLLAALAELSQGRTVEVTTRLLEENVVLAAAVAAALAGERASAGRRANNDTRTREAIT